MVKNKKVIVIGGGAAGVMAAIHASVPGVSVTLLEKNEKIGKKIYITGKGRCNVTNACDTVEYFQSVVSNPKFLYSAVYGFDAFRVMEYFEELGCRMKVERGNRVFPISDHASDVIKVLQNELKEKKVDVRYHTIVKELIIKNGFVKGVMLDDGSTLEADAVCIATGGLSYPTTGSTGDGYRFAIEAGHSIVPCKAALSAMEVKGESCRELQGLSLKNVQLKLFADGKALYEDFGEMLFTHFGISGPIVLSASSYLAKDKKGQAYHVEIDLKPALDMEQLDKRILRDFEEQQNKNFSNSLNNLLPAKLIPEMIKRSEMDPYKKVNEITREERQKFAYQLKHMRLDIVKNRPIEQAIITKGGISVKEVDPHTMESKIVNGLYFAGEVLDVDALTGGFNLQIAWSTGYLAGLSMIESFENELKEYEE